MKRTLKKGICIATAAMMVAGMTSVTALADDTKASGKINFYYWDADQTNEVNKVIELFNEQNPDALRFYEKNGFVPLDKEQKADGIRFTPMRKMI